jgi:pimeloyl-ACP methyl ester carboxylesterase
VEAESHLLILPHSCANTVRAPTLILAGYEDPFCGIDLFTETARLIPNSRRRLFGGRGHLTVSADPELADEVEHFLASPDA